MAPPSNVVDFSDHRPPEHDQAVAKAMAWLVDRHRKGWTNAFTATLADFSPGGSLDLAALGEHAAQSFMINIGEWLLARGRIHARGGLQDINAYLHLAREVTNPRSPQALAAVAGKRPAAPTDIDPQRLGEAVSQLLRRSYANWADEPIPVLDGKTPRQAIATPAGLERVKGLLRQYEAGEAEQARAQGRPEVSFPFLWDALGLGR